jgi:hypothetical protein
MFLSPEFWGCKYTNNFLFINKNPVFQHFGLLITPLSLSFIPLPSIFLYFYPAPSPFPVVAHLPIPPYTPQSPLPPSSNPSSPRATGGVYGISLSVAGQKRVEIAKYWTVRQSYGQKAACRWQARHFLTKYRNGQEKFYTFALDFMAFRERCGE